ncbi:uncharacterized protein [Triticum aestivum]|nr:uncharacterized protein LOC123141483 isoform X2 [Triticum aestivum]
MDPSVLTNEFRLFFSFVLLRSLRLLLLAQVVHLVCCSISSPFCSLLHLRSAHQGILQSNFTRSAVSSRQIAIRYERDKRQKNPMEEFGEEQGKGKEATLMLFR